MGLGVGFVLAKTGLNSFLRPTLSARDVAQGFHDFLRGEPILGEVALLREKSAAEFGISVLPIEEDIEITQDGRRVVLAGRTSAAGPGFHAYLIGKIKEFARLRKITIKENEEWADETEYFSHNDYSKLQDAMRSHLEQLWRMVLEKASGDGEIANIALSMPLEGIPVGFENSVLTQRGPRDGTFFAGPIEPALYFPWWQQGINPDSAYSLAEALLWTAFPWRRSVNEQEQAVEQLISELLEIARPSLASQIDASLVGNFEVARRSTDAPHPEGIGYLRHPCRQRVTGSWSVKVPGYFLKEFDPSDGLSRFWIGKRIFRYLPIGWRAGLILSTATRRRSSKRSTGYFSKPMLVPLMQETGRDIVFGVLQLATVASPKSL